MVNAFGVKKIKRNIMSMQQTLRGMVKGTTDNVLSRSLGYWDLYEEGPKVSLVS
jgi:exocyst complex component 4